MKRLISKIVSFIALSLAATAIIISPASAQGDLLSGQNHFYTVVFRGNGEAIVYAKLAINNVSDKTITNFSFSMPRVAPSEFVMFQMKSQPRCLNYDYAAPGRPCSRYAEPDYTQQYNYDSSGQTQYQKISSYDKSGNRYAFDLPTPIDPGKSTAIIIAYAAQGYSRSSFGAHKFMFETLKVASRIQQVTVSVDVDSDQILKGKKSNINYATSDIATLGLESGVTTGLSSPAMDKAVSRIGSTGPLTKTAKNLAPDESLTVKGEYADSWFALYWTSLLLALLIVAAIIVGAIFFGKFLKRRKSHAAKTPSAPASAQAEKEWSILNPAHIWISLISVAATIGFAYLLPVIDGFMSRGVNDPIFSIVTVIAILLFFIIAIFGPPVYAGVKYGRKSFAVIFLADFLWIVLFLIIYFVLFRSGVIPPQVNSVYY